MLTQAAAAPIDASEAARLFAPLAGLSPLLVAVSGGADSLCLMRLLAAWREAQPVPPALHAATVDHGLRPASAAEARRVGAWAGALGLPHAVLRWEGEKPSTGLQEAAREARYALLEAHARELGARVLLTAHHADDQAETVLMRLLRGSGIHGLAGMPASRLRGHGLLHLRPLLGLPKERLVATLEAEGHPWIEDPSNTDPRFTRAGLRAQRPDWERHGLTRERLLTLGERARRADEALDLLAAETLAATLEAEDGERAVLAPAILARPDEILLRVLLVLLERLAGPAGLADPIRLERLEALVASLREARSHQAVLRRTLAGSLVTLDRHARVTIAREKPRRRGRRDGDEREAGDGPAGP